MKCLLNCLPACKVHPKDVAVVVPAVLAAHVLHHVVHEGSLEEAQLEAALVALIKKGSLKYHSSFQRSFTG